MDYPFDGWFYRILINECRRRKNKLKIRFFHETDDEPLQFKSTMKDRDFEDQITQALYSATQNASVNQSTLKEKIFQSLYEQEKGCRNMRKKNIITISASAVAACMILGFFTLVPTGKVLAREIYDSLP